MVNKVVFVQAHFMPVGEYVDVRTPTGEVSSGWFGEKQETKLEKEFHQTGFSDSAVDSKRLADDVVKTVADLNGMGYEVVTVTPVTSAKHKHGEVYALLAVEGGYGYGYGFTSGVIIVGKKIKSQA